MALSSIIILIDFVLPIYCLFAKRRDLFCIWIGLISIVDIFNSQAILNLSAFKIAGLIVLPILLKSFFNLVKNKNIKLITTYLIWLLILGIIWGVWFPWEDPTFIRKAKDLPPIRPLLHLGSLALELSTTTYLALCFKYDLKNINRTLYAIIFGAFFNSVGALLETVFLFDFYSFFTNGTRMVLTDMRPRGFSYEPRGLAQSTAAGLILSLILFRNLKYKNILFLSPIFLFCIYFGFIAPMSMAGFATLTIGLATYTLSKFFIEPKGRSLAIFTSIAFILLCAFSYFLLPTRNKEYFNTHLQRRLPSLSLTSLFNGLEDQESSVINFFIQNPQYILTGTGPGMAYIPAVSYRQEKYLKNDNSIETNPHNVLPHHGILLQFSNGGLIGLMILAFLLYQLFKSITNNSKTRSHVIAFIVFSTLYLFQIRLYYYVAIAIGLGYSFLSNGKDKSIEQVN